MKTTTKEEQLTAVPSDVAEAETSTALTKPETIADMVLQAPDAPDWLPRTQTGVHIGVEDSRIPRLSLTQTTSKQIQPDAAEYIDGLKFGDAFNDLTSKIYGRDPLTIVVIRADKPKWIEFADDFSVVDMNVKANDPRTQFTTAPDGTRQTPQATKFYDYIIVKLPEWEPLAFSASRSAIRHTADKLNGLIKMKPFPAFACAYLFTPVKITNSFGSWYVFSPRNAGFLSKEAFSRAEAIYKVFETKDVDFGDRQPGDDDPDL